MAKEYEIYSYSIDHLLNIFSEKSKTEISAIKEKSHLQYFNTYFTFLQAKIILVENNYIDHDYLEDYAGYYVRSFKDYNKVCTRVHFFQNQFDDLKFTELLSNANTTSLMIEELKKSYLGFIVIKPIPRTFIGRTCLRTYPSENRRNFPIIREYITSLFGIELTVNSIAYQEQDSIVAACATSALWSAFQGTGLLFQHYIPSPVEITRAATKHLPFETRFFPNKGLSPEQMAHAIRNVGLEPVLINSKDYFILKSSLYAYLKCGIPLILGFSLFEQNSLIGKHAVAISGFSINNDINIINNIKLISDKIDKCYVHDDQVGPFARMIFDNINIEKSYDNHKKKYPSLLTSWKDKNGETNSIRAIPEILLIPVYHKIRIPYNIIFEIVVHFDHLLKSLNDPYFKNISENLEWDIYLTTISSIKKSYLENINLTGLYCKKILTEAMPKFIWRAIARKDSQEVIELLFDATDIEQGTIFIRPIEYDSIFSSNLRYLIKALKATMVVNNTYLNCIFDWFNKHPI